METYIALLLMIAPGFIARIISKYLTKNSKENFEIDSIIMSLIYSIFIMLLNALCLSIRYNIQEIGTLVEMFKSLRFIIKYTVVTLINGFYIAFFWTFCSNMFINFINYIRKHEGKRILSKSNSFLDSMALDGYDHALRIENGEKVSNGFVYSFERDDNGKIIGIVLNRIKELEDKLREKGQINFPIKQTLVDINSNLRISEYNSDKYRRTKTKSTKSKLQLLALGLLSFFIVHGIIIVVSIWIV